jgi:hypothetical protein
MLVNITIDVDSSTVAERHAEIRRLLILVDLLASGCEVVSLDEHVAGALRAATR